MRRSLRQVREELRRQGGEPGDGLQDEHGQGRVAQAVLHGPLQGPAHGLAEGGRQDGRRGQGAVRQELLPGADHDQVRAQVAARGRLHPHQRALQVPRRGQGEGVLRGQEGHRVHGHGQVQDRRPGHLRDAAHRLQGQERLRRELQGGGPGLRGAQEDVREAGEQELPQGLRHRAGRREGQVRGGGCRRAGRVREGLPRDQGGRRADEVRGGDGAEVPEEVQGQLRRHRHERLPGEPRRPG
mmetsp:Transcript_2585/g.7785  ORF Transcript_2585/g.7785 Transcript_2585/m.7785 type:complete len:241 (-) Transcript_2585:188-910(-)